MHRRLLNCIISLHTNPNFQELDPLNTTKSYYRLKYLLKHYRVLVLNDLSYYADNIPTTRILYGILEAVDHYLYGDEYRCSQTFNRLLNEIQAVYPIDETLLLQDIDDKLKFHIFYLAKLCDQPTYTRVGNIEPAHLELSRILHLIIVWFPIRTFCNLMVARNAEEEAQPIFKNLLLERIHRKNVNDFEFFVDQKLHNFS